MRLVGLIFLLIQGLAPVAAAQTAWRTGNNLAAVEGELPRLLGHFSGESTISDRGRLYTWSYNASLAVHETPYFGKVPTLLVAVRDPGMSTVYYLNLLSGDVALVLSPSPSGAKDNETSHVRASEPGYTNTLTTIKDILSTMISLDSRNAPLSEAVNYLVVKIAEQQPTTN